MSLKKGTFCVTTPIGIHEHNYYDNPLWQDKGLTQKNVKKDMNDIQLRNVFEKYDLFSKL